MSHKTRRRLASVLSALLMASLVGAAPARAEPANNEKTQASTLNEVGTLATCYGGAIRTVFQVGGWGGDAGPFYASTRCRDINVRNDSVYGTQACVIFVNKTSGCNYWTYLPAKSGWFVVASNVIDGTKFKVRFSNSTYRYDPLVSYTAY